MNTATRSLASNQAAVLAAFASILSLTWLGDFLFWKSQPGVSVGIFASAVAAGLMATGRRSPAAWLAMALLLASSVQSAIELCFTNIACLVTTLFVLLGETHYHGLSRGWARWSEAVFGFLTGPLRWGEIVAVFVETRLAAAGISGIRSGWLTQVIRVAFPAAIAAGVFALLLGSGNVVLYEGFARLVRRAVHFLGEMSIARTALWVVWLTAGVCLFWPSGTPAKPRWWTFTPRRWVRDDPRIARWQSGILLLAVNAVFFAANTTDAIYLWADTSLPRNVTPSQFVHQGVHSLIAAVVLAAVVLVAAFHQSETVSGSKILKALALAWIVQNLALIASVFLRLKLYIDAYQLSELRVYTGCFLALVCTGFGFLAWHIARGLQIHRLVFENTCATFALFFILQWCDVGTWVAQRNVARWEVEPNRTLDLAYLAALGPCGWPALEAVAGSTHHPDTAAEAAQRLRDTAIEIARLKSPDWRSYQARRDTRARQLIENHL
jgi:hypothetical protein